MSRECRAWWRWMSTRPCAWRRCRAKQLAAELRWILLALSLPLLAGIWWWTARRAGQTPGNPELRESMPPFDSRYADSGDDDMRQEPEREPEPDPVPGTPSRSEPGTPSRPEPVISPAAEQQRIVTIRVCAVGETRWPGT